MKPTACCCQCAWTVRFKLCFLLLPIQCSTGHKGKFGHEFMEFELRPDGRLRYANNSNYKNDTMIRKEVRVSKAVLEEVKRIVEESEILKCVCLPPRRLRNSRVRLICLFQP